MFSAHKAGQLKAVKSVLDLPQSTDASISEEVLLLWQAYTWQAVLDAPEGLFTHMQGGGDGCGWNSGASSAAIYYRNHTLLLAVVP